MRFICLTSQKMEQIKFLCELFRILVGKAKVGVTTKQLDEFAEKYIIDHGYQPFNKGYKHQICEFPYPATLCTSVNEVIAHGFPSDYKLQDGDLINIDTAVWKDNRCADAAMSIGIGQISERDQELLTVAKKVLWAGIESIKPKVQVKDIGSIMNKKAEELGYVTNRYLGGHGIGENMHQYPTIPNFYDHNNNQIVEEGMIICLEPQVTKKDREGIISNGGWTLKTKDNKKSAYFEHMIRVGKEGPEILTDHFTYP